MPYSTDSDQNKENPVSPSTIVLQDQLLYKLASLDASVQSGFRRLDEKMDRLQTDMHDRHIEMNDRINQLDKETAESFLRKRERMDRIEEWIRREKQEGLQRYEERCNTTDKRLNDIETWQKVLLARVGVAVTALVVIWTLLGPSIRNLLGISNG